MTGGEVRLLRGKPLAILLLAAAAGALAFRLPGLDRRPMHGDEANQAVKAGELRDGGAYVYDPKDHHGPSLYFLTLPSLWLSPARRFAETGETAYRIVPALFGAALILLLLPAAGALGRPAAAVAAALTAISPAMVYYSRYYIQETLLVFFTFAALASSWRYWRTRSTGWAAAAGAFFGLMHATKETWVLAAAAMGAALGLTMLWTRRLGDGEEAGPKIPWRRRAEQALVAAAAGLLVAALFYSSFGANLRGPLDSVLAFTTYGKRAGGEGIHEHPWHFYLTLLTAYRPSRGFFWSEGLIVGLAIAGAVAGLMRRGVPDGSTLAVRFLAFYTAVLTALYAAIPYKTPWCLLGFLHGMILLAGVGAAALVRWIPRTWGRWAAATVLAGLAFQLGWQSCRLNFRFPADQRNPYVYAHTSSDALNLTELVGRVAQGRPRPEAATIHVVTPENYWPLPWYLRKFENVGWSHEVPPDPAVGLDADMIITSPEIQYWVDARLREKYARPGFYGLRPGVLLMLYVREDLWSSFLARQKPGPRR
jgi:uncharacterized protein (TIGR03663 family)